MAEPLEIAITYGEKNHIITVDAGDGDSANEAKERVGFILDLFAGSADTKKRVSAKPAAPTTPKPPTTITASSMEKPSAGGVK
jgi:hypothetical protein